MTMRQTPPFRADQVGSLLRPARLADARAKAAKGEITAESLGGTDDGSLRAVENECIREAVAAQERAGLHAVTDGEFRRGSWVMDFFLGLDGIEEKELSDVPAFSSGFRPTSMATTGKIGNPTGVTVEDFKFLKSVATKTAKQCIPSPSLAYHRGGRAMIDKGIYPEIEDYWRDLWSAYKNEVKLLADAGCSYLQLDDTTFAMICDPKVRQSFVDRGDDPDAMLATYARGINEVAAARPDGMAITVHMCRGNFQSSWIAEGGYEPVAELLFSEVNVDGFFMEWDSERSGGFEPLRFVRDDQIVVLGLITSKTPELEDKDLIKRRLDEAAKYVPLERLCLSPQCGFASTHQGNKLSEDEQWRKLEWVVEIADEVWG